MNSYPNEFAAWLASLVGEGRKYSSIRELAASIGISDTSVHRYMDGTIPRVQILQKIARAEPEYSIEDLQRMAGILPSQEDQVKERVIRAMENILARLPEEDQQFILDMAKRMLEKNRQESEE